MSVRAKDDEKKPKIDLFKNDIRFRHHIEYVETIPEKEAEYRHVDGLEDKIQDYLDKNGIRLYQHQALSIEKVRAGKNIIITTPTASGKTLAFNLPVFEELIKDNDACAMYIYPAKALSYDQLDVLRRLEDELDVEVNPNAYDGDTPKPKRRRIRNESRIIITNPYQIHHILSWHHQWERFYSNLKFIIIDEAHYYKGIFGSNIALLIRRLKRIANYYGSNPKFILSSATLANPLELANKLTGEEFELVDNDTSPSGEKDFILYNPYKDVSGLIGTKDFDSPSVHRVTEQILLYLILKDIQTLCFTSSRKMAELIALWTKKDMDSIKRQYVERISAYRAGYLAEERREIENGLKSKKYLGVTTTSALELGINIGTLDAVIISGFPGSMISTWQQAGRAGRGAQKSLVILVAFENQLDQYFMNNPEFFFDKPHENAVIDLNNEKLIRNHLICASNELPITEDEAKYFFNADDELLDGIVRSRDLRRSNGMYLYPYTDSPSFRYSLDQISNEIFTVMNGDKVLERIERSQMYREAHEGAVLINKGETYIVTNVNFDTHIIDVVKRSVNAHTMALKRTKTKIIKKIKKERIGDFTLHFGEIEVEENYYAYKRMEFSKTIGTYPLDLPPLKFKTKGLWFTIPDSVKQYLEDHYDDDDVFPGGLHGAEHALIGLFSLHVMCDRFDIGGLSTNYHEDTQEASIFIYDAFEGGIGICEKAVEVFKDLTESTRQLLKTCQCENGCPSCIYSPKCGNDNKPLHKKATEYVLDYMHEEMNKLSPEELNDLKRKQLPNPYDDYENEDLSALYSEIFKEDKYYEMESSKEDYSKLERELNSSGIVDYADIDSKLNDENDSLPEFSEEELLIRSEYEDALEEFNKGNYSSAKDILNDILIKTDKINADAYYLIGKILYVQGDKKGAVSFVKKAISLEGAYEEANDLLIEIKKDLKS